jgi:hypothetical protein
MVQFLSINFFSWISSIFVGVFKSSRFFVSSCTNGRVDGVCVLRAAYGEHLVEPAALMFAELLKNTRLFRSACGLHL